MDVNRRSFLGGALSLIAATALPAAAFASAPTIYGDGVRDDWAGLQALMDGEPFRVAGSGPMILKGDGASVIMGRGDFLISRTIRVRSAVLVMIESCTLRTTPNFEGEAILDFLNATSVHVDKVEFYLPPAWRGYGVMIPAP